VGRGVRFRQEPTDLPYGVQAQLEDLDANVFLLQQA
jgi:hypothetical protein